ncbi:MAG: hypothetical protein EBW16_06750 [Burkholderiaceae bacterium]|nr:hypothetical protein [Burkholderiaceae bacterium]
MRVAPKVAKDSQCNELKSARIQALLRTRSISSEAWAVYADSKERGNLDLGLAIAKKLAKRAVDRNRLKRAARELARKGSLGNFSELVDHHRLTNCYRASSPKSLVPPKGVFA